MTLFFRSSPLQTLQSLLSRPCRLHPLRSWRRLPRLNRSHGGAGGSNRRYHRGHEKGPPQRERLYVTWFSLNFVLSCRSAFSAADVFLDNGPDDPITQPTNRGNKLRANARFVREGALGYIHPEELYKQVRLCASRATIQCCVPPTALGSIFIAILNRWTDCNGFQPIEN